MNELDQIIRRLQRSRSAFPDLCRCLCKGELFILVPYHPEMENTTLELQKGMQFPFSLFKNDRGESVPVFSSMERANEGLTRSKAESGKFIIGSMESLRAIEIIGKSNLHMTLNMCCTTGEVTLPPDLLRDLADGTALKPSYGSGKTEDMTLTLVKPADYPTDIVQAAFEMFRKYSNFKAAWILTRENQPGHYYILVVMQPWDAKVFRDYELATAVAAGKCAVHSNVAKENDTEQIATMFKCGPPFYQAADFQAPTPPAKP